MNIELLSLLQAMPKAELHLHIEGTLEPGLLFELARQNHVSIPYQSVDALKTAYNFNNLQEFLDLYYQGMSVLQTEDDFYALTMAYLERVNAQKVRHVEIFFDPQAHLARKVPLLAQVAGIHKALSDGTKRFGISFKIILSFLRHLEEENAFAMLEAAERFRHLIDGIGLDSSELDHPPSKFARVFSACRERGYRLTAHAGEEGPSTYVQEAVELLNVDRIDHGNRSLEDPAVVEILKNRGLTLTICPLSNLKLKVIPDMRLHPLPQMLDQGLKVTVNSDDPAYFGGYIQENFLSLLEHDLLTKPQLAQLARNAFTGSWLTMDEQTTHLREIDTIFGES